MILMLASPAFSQQPESPARRAAAIADYRKSCAPQIAIYIGEKVGRSSVNTDFLFTQYRSADYNSGENGMLMDPVGLRNGLRREIAGAARFNDKSRLGVCVFQVALRHAEQGVPGFERGTGATSPPRSRIASQPVPSPAPKAAAPAKKLPPARPAKMLPWSTRAMPTKPESQLSPRYAAERADALASCTVPIQASVQVYSLGTAYTTEEANLRFEHSWLQDSDLDDSPSEIQATITKLDGRISNGSSDVTDPPTWRAFRCLSQRRLAQLGGSPLATGAVDGTLTPLSIGGQTPPWTQQGKDARIIASDGKSAMDCVKLVELASGNSRVSGGGRVLSNQCAGPVEIVWCISPDECERKMGNMWTVSAGGSWPVSSEGTVRWAACRGANTAAFVKDTYGLRYYCTAPAKK